MMPVGSLGRMVMSNTLRSPRHFILSAFGIVIGIGAFVLFLALTQRAGDTLERVFPVDEVQVVAPTISMLGSDRSKRLDQGTVDRILARKEVASAVPRMNIGFPAALRGSFEGKEFKLELGGFADGVDAGFVQDDDRIKDLFRDWDSVKDDPNRIACVPPPPDPYDDVAESPKTPGKARQKTGWGDEPPPETKSQLAPGTPPPIPSDYVMPRTRARARPRTRARPRAPPSSSRRRRRSRSRTSIRARTPSATTATTPSACASTASRPC